MDVQRLVWPDDEARREALRRARLPRLLLVGTGGMVPMVTDPLEDWVWASSPDAEVRARIDTLQRRASELNRPVLDPDGVLRYASGWTTLPPVEARLCRALVTSFGTVVGRDEIASAGWPDGSPGRNALDVHMLRLRRRVQAVGLTIRTVRSRGYLLDQAAPGAGGRSESRQETDDDQ